MDTTRKVTEWVSKHRILTTFIILGLIMVFLAIKTITERSDGLLSNFIQKGSIVDAVYGIGTVTATRSYSVKPGVIATISHLYVKEGDTVHKGSNLALIDNVTYRAPFDGVINFLPFKVGENIFTQLPAMVLTDLRDRYIVVSLEQQGALRIKAGQKAKLSFDTIRNQNYDGAVKSVYSYHNNFLARIEVLSLPEEILPDMTADIAIIVQELKDVLVIPLSAYENGFVWVKRGHMIPIKTPITLGIVDGTTAEVKSGDVKPGDRLMIHKKVSP